jgi:hypothetical protein
VFSLYPEIFPEFIFNLESMINMLAILETHGAHYSFRWIGIDRWIEAEGIFLDF